MGRSKSTTRKYESAEKKGRKLKKRVNDRQGEKILGL